MFGLSLYTFSTSGWSDNLPQFFSLQQPEDLFADSEISEPENKNFEYSAQRVYFGEDQPQEKSMLEHDLYQSEGFRFYNNTQYSLDDVKNKYLHAQASQITLEDLSISLGYGMEFKLSRYQSLGYEYLSSFPHDRGQCIRLFWKRSF